MTIDDVTHRDDPEKQILVVGDTSWQNTVITALEKTAITMTATANTEIARSELDSGAVACLVCTQALPDGDGFDLCRSARTVRPTLPVVMGVEAASGQVANETASLGSATYLPREKTEPSQIREIVEAAIQAGNIERSRHERAQLFDAAFNDVSLQWVLTGNGRVCRANENARAAIGREESAVQGTNWWDGPWWTAGDAQELRACVDRARGGDDASIETTAFVEPGTRATVEVTVRRAGADRLLATADDISERAQLAERLQRSEELHRVTLNNMTDTVLVTDDEGRFTYICPNVHFIFGYTVDEIEAMGTIDALLGADLFDPEELNEHGVLTNIECTTADKAGEDHTLLVNVKEVSIQGGTTLYSCRDITTRKQRERALSTLHHTARELSYAETDLEIAQIVVADATDVLSREAIALYRYDADANLLRPVASTSAMDRRYGLLHPVDPGDDGIGRAFLGGEPIEEVEIGTDVDGGQALCIPVGDHGVLVVGTDEGIDDVLREVAELVAATAEATFDRVQREATLRDRDRRLSEQNRKLERANRINDLIREVDRAIVRAETRTEIEHAVCERLVAADRFTFAWIGERTATEGIIQPRAWDGVDRGYLDQAIVEATDSMEPTARTVASGKPSAVVNIADDPRAAPWRKTALACGFQSVVSVPLVADDAHHGTLTVYADRADAFDDVTRSVLTELGGTVGSAISAVARKEALLGETVTELEYEIGEPMGPLGHVARRAECTLVLEGMIHREDGVLAFVTVEGALADCVATLAEQRSDVSEIRVVTEGTDGGVIQIRVTGTFIATVLADHGAVLHDLSVAADGARLTVEVPSPVATRTVNDVLVEQYPDATLRAQRDRSRSVTDGRSRFIDRLTDRQLEVVRTAYHAGYFASPRESTGEVIADALGISPQAFYQHIRATQRKLFDTAFANPDELIVE